jgi:signal transduction histidine kinase
LFPWYGTVIVGALAAGSIVAYLNLTPSVMFGDVANVLMMIINLTILTIIFTNHRDRLEAARQLELREVNSQLKEQAEQLNTALEKAKEANRLKSDFLATMSHELRTPLNAIIGFTEIMLAGMGGQIDEDATHMTERIHANSKRQLTLINDVLDLAKIESRRVDIVKKPFSLQTMIDGLVSETEVLAKQKNLDYQVKIDPNLPDMLIGDQGHIEQVISNLLSNAFKFTERGHVRLMVSQLDEDRWTINVSDSGVGIPPHALEYIFDPFRQVDSSPERVYQGTGLGLAIVDELVRAMDGTIKVESALGRGSIFVVSLPLDRVTQAEARKVQA